MVEYRLAKARVAGSNPVSCSQRDRKKSHPMDGSFFYVQALPGSNGSNLKKTNKCSIWILYKMSIVGLEIITYTYV